MSPANLPLITTVVSDIIESYTRGDGTKSIAERLCVHESTVQKYLRRAGILKPKHIYVHTRSFFASYTPESAYWAGFIMADGYVSSNRNMVGIHVQHQDKEHLEHFLRAIGATNKLIHDSHANAWCVQIYSTELKQDLLNNFNITPRKSKTALYPSHIPSNFNSHFIRGIMDGDGSLSHTTMRTLSFVGTKLILTSINDIITSAADLKINGGKTKYAVCIPHKDKPWFASLSIYGRNADKALNWLYTGSTPNTRLFRKYELYLNNFQRG